MLTGVSTFESSLEIVPILNEARALPYEKSKESHERNKANYDRKHKAYNFKIGDLVLIDSHSMGKLEPRRIGPFKIIEKLSENSFRLHIPNELRKNKLVNSEQMHPYNSI